MASATPTERGRRGRARSARTVTIMGDDPGRAPALILHGCLERRRSSSKSSLEHSQIAGEPDRDHWKAMWNETVKPNKEAGACARAYVGARRVRL
jgi:hypothetical protein